MMAFTSEKTVKGRWKHYKTAKREDQLNVPNTVQKRRKMNEKNLKKDVCSI